MATLNSNNNSDFSNMTRATGLCPGDAAIHAAVLSLPAAGDVHAPGNLRAAESVPTAHGQTLAHSLVCPVCLAEFRAVVQDMEAASQVAVPAAEHPADRAQKLSRSFSLRGLRYSIFAQSRSPFLPRALPAFRSQAAEVSAVVHSSIVPLGQDYVIMELASSESEIRLNLEQGLKNQAPIQISLYTGSQLSDKRKLQNRLS